MPSTTYTGPDWSQNPQGLGQNSNFGSNVDRHKTKGSPVVPGSLVTVTSDNDSTLFMVTILRSMYEVSFILCQHKMCTRTYALTLIQCTSCAQPPNQINRPDTTKAKNSSPEPKSTSKKPSPKSYAKNATSYANSTTTHPNKARPAWHSNNSKSRWITCALGLLDGVRLIMGRHLWHGCILK